METRAPWSGRIEDHLEPGAVGAALAVLDEPAAPHPHEHLSEFAAYLRAQAPHIPHCAARRAAGQSIGSGVSEKGVDAVVNRRLKGKRGMRRWRTRADGVVAMRVARLDEEWDRRLPQALTA
jgi:hypothetical protein